MSADNLAWTFAKRPAPEITSETFKVTKVNTPKAEDLKDGEILLKLSYISVDPYMRPRMNEANYFMPLKEGQVMDGGCTAVVVSSKNANFVAGDHVQGFLPWQQYSVHSGAGLQKLNVDIIPESSYLGAVGMPGLSAYFPITEIGHPKAGETVYVSGAAGAVGLTAGQIFKIFGCRVIGSAGTDDKVALCKEYGYDEVFNYKTTSVKDALASFAPKGVDIYFDNVGGEMLDTTLEHMNRFGRVVLCGAISQYNKAKGETYGLRNLFHAIGKELKLEGFIVSRWAARFGEGGQQLAKWVAEGKLKVKVTEIQGFEKAPEALQGLFVGDNIGKMVVKV